MTRSRHRSSKYNRSRRPRSLSQKQYRKYVGWGGGRRRKYGGRTSRMIGGLVNRSFCKNGTDEHPEPALTGREYDKRTKIMSPGFEILMSTDKPFELKAETLDVFNTFNRKDNKWFKFVIFRFKDKNYLYVMYGNPEYNKHPMCMIYGFLEHSSDEEYPEFRKAITDLHTLKQSIDDKKVSIDGIDENNEVILSFNKRLFENFKCMEALSAGSGTILDDGSICLNNKSGHFKPRMSDLEIAKQMFESVTGKTVRTRLAADKALVETELSSIPGFKYDNFTGTCLATQDDANL